MSSIPRPGEIRRTGGKVISAGDGPSRTVRRAEPATQVAEPTVGALNYKIGKLEEQLTVLATRQSHPLHGWLAHQVRVDPDPNVRDVISAHPVAWLPANGGGLVAMVLDQATGRTKALPKATSTEGWSLTPPGAMPNLTATVRTVKALRAVEEKARAEAEEKAHAEARAKQIQDARNAVQEAYLIARPRTINQNGAIA